MALVIKCRFGCSMFVWREERGGGVSTQPSAQTLLVHSFQSRHRHSIVMTLHIHVGPGLESFVRKTSFVFIVAILC